MSLSKIFDEDHLYDPKLVNKYLLIIKTSPNNPTKLEKYSILLFQIMKEIVNKNINNFLLLLKNAGLDKGDLQKEDLIADCYCIFHKCVNNFRVKKENNFYFYFNKSMSRSFFRDYQKAVRKSRKMINGFEVTDDSIGIMQHFDLMEFLLKQLRFNDIQKTIIESKLVGQKLEDFFELNPDISSVIYYQNLKEIKERIAAHDHEIGASKIQSGQLYKSQRSKRIYQVIELDVTGIVIIKDKKDPMVARHPKIKFERLIQEGTFVLIQDSKIQKAYGALN